VSNLPLEYTIDELLQTHPISEPLVAGGIRCHGGFDADGSYVSPRTKVRWPAIEAWQEHHRETFGTELLDIPLETWPESYPNVAQAKHLLREGVRDPIISTLTRVGTVEGFGAMIRYSTVGDPQRFFADDVRGTALAHIDRGLFEAHARDEAGYEDEGGHKQMWFAARDVAFENPVTEDQTAEMLQRMGFSGGGSSVPTPEAMRQQMEEMRVFRDLDLGLEMLVQRMTRLLLIEISAFHVFAWAEEVLSDGALVAGDGEAARLVSYVRQDESPHVAYLKTVLSEMRERTFKGESGKQYPGTEIVGSLWDRAVGESLGVRRDQGLKLALREVEHALASHARRTDILERFHELGSIRPADDGRSFVSASTY
jgi:hypothetical protein